LKIDTELSCLHCDRETPHSIIYRGKYIHKIKCLECGTELAINSRRILDTYTSDAIERFLTRTRGINEEMRKDLTLFIAGLPVRIVTKPVRMAKEFLDVFKQKKP
jgi:uncharacterized Zn finger protein